MMKAETLKTAVVNLNELDGFPVYVAIYSPGIDRNKFIFSPSAMQWSDRIVLNRLDCCEFFWLSQRDKMQCDLETLFSSVLKHYFDTDFIAVFSRHPWQSLMYLSYQCQQGARGIYFLQNRLNRNIFRKLGWQFWFEPQSDLFSRMASMRIKNFNPEVVRRHQGRLQRFIERVGINGPHEMSRVDYQSFSRRYGVWLGKLLSWTLYETDDLSGFPWVAIAYSDEPSVSRELEYPVNLWTVVEGLLTEDFVKLAESISSTDQEHINRISWKIRLYNQRLVEIDINFRFPYSLQQDQPEFKTALYQARYVYEDLMAKLQARDKDLDLPEMMPLLGWRIEICERFTLPPILRDLFSDGPDNNSDMAIVDLQNKLPVEIESYRHSRSFYPEQSFKHRLINHRPNKTGSDLQWLQQSCFRPLFYYPVAESLESPPPGAVVFLERTACDWWQQQSCDAINRDYFQLKNKDGRMSWAYRSADGSWFKQGEYS